MAMNVGSVTFHIGGGRKPTRRVMATEPETTLALPETIDGDELEIILGGRSRVLRLKGLRSVRRAFCPTFLFVQGEPYPETLILELPDLVEALALVVEIPAVHAPRLENLGLLSVSSERAQRISLPALSSLHQAFVLAPKLKSIVLGPGAIDGLVTIYAPETAEVIVPMMMSARGSARVHRPPSMRLALLEVTHWFTPRAYRDDEATYDADNLIFELHEGDDLKEMGRRAMSYRCGPAAKVHSVGVDELKSEVAPAWYVVPRNTIARQEPWSGNFGPFTNWERTADPSPDEAHEWARRVRSMGALWSPPAAAPPRVAIFCCTEDDASALASLPRVNARLFDDLEALLAFDPEYIVVIGGPAAFYVDLGERMSAVGNRARLLVIGRPPDVSLPFLHAGRVDRPEDWRKHLLQMLADAGADV